MVAELIHGLPIDVRGPVQVIDIDLTFQEAITLVKPANEKREPTRRRS